jgi:hypothetical protein
MTHHFTKNTVQAPFHCGKCGKETAHRIDGGRKGPCLECMTRLEKEHDAKGEQKPPAKQMGLF